MTDLHLIFSVARAFVLARLRQSRLRDRDAIRRFQDSRLNALVAYSTKQFPFYAPYAGGSFGSLPKLDKQRLLESLPQLTTAEVTVEEIRSALARGEDAVKGLRIGQSTGTSGNRGYFVISETERFVWLGTILAKTLPDALWRRHRVALALPGSSSLYRAAIESGRIALGFFDLARGLDNLVEDLAAFAPDTLVAPPKVLRWLAERGRLPTRRLFSGAETLDPIDRDVIEAASGVPLREIYMATEGLFGVSCEHGTLHLAEDVVHFEWEPSGTLVCPVVTDFTRRAQAMIRYRMNDLLELDPVACPCGSAFQAVKRVVGRQDDCLLLPDASGALRLVTPDVVRNAVVDAHLSIRDFRVTQVDATTVVIALPEDAALDADGLAVESLRGRFARLGVHARIICKRGIETPFDRKLRRVQRL